MTKKRSVFNKRQRALMVWLSTEQMKFQQTGEAQTFTIEEVAEHFNLAPEQAVAAIMFMQVTAIPAKHA